MQVGGTGLAVCGHAGAGTSPTSAVVAPRCQHGGCFTDALQTINQHVGCEAAPQSKGQLAWSRTRSDK